MPTPPEQAVLKIPEADASAELTRRIEAGAKLRTEQPASRDEIDDLSARVQRWRAYNRTWLDNNLGGEAADDYRTASNHFHTYTGSDPTALLRFLRDEIRDEVTSLESIKDRLHMWVPQPQAAPTTAGGDLVSESASIFIVHGRDIASAQNVARVVERATKTNTVILHEQANLGRTLIEKFEDHANEVAYAIVVLTPDDQGSLAGQTELQPRGRQNVIFEMGYFFGLIGRRRVSVLARPNVEKPTDVDGIVYIPFDDHGGWTNDLFRELTHAGFQIDHS